MAAPVQAWATTLGLAAMPPRAPVDSSAHRLAIAEVFARYGIAHDEGDAAAMSDLFTETAVLEVSMAGPVFQRVAGRVAIVANFATVFAQQTDQRRHAISNICLDAATGGTARAAAYGLVSAAIDRDLRLAASCIYTADLLLGQDGLWRFARLWIGLDLYTGAAPRVDPATLLP